ncbi:MAG: ABC transporter permease [Chloroflexota bacterium]
MMGCFVVAVFVFTAIGAPHLAPPQTEDPYIIPTGKSYGITPKPPSPEFPLGLMQNQADVLYGLIWGTRVAFKVSLLVVLGRTFIGLVIGVLSGYFGGIVDSILMRITDAFLSFPIMAVVLVMLTLFGGGWLGIQTGGVDRIIVLALISFGWMQIARLIRGNVLVEREQEYVQAAISLGARTPRIIFKHILPNAYQGLLVLITSDIGSIVVWMAVFNFMGFSSSYVTADWGKMLNISRNWIIGTPTNAFKYWYTYLPTSLAIVLFSIGWNLIGDGLRNTLDLRYSRPS